MYDAPNTAEGSTETPVAEVTETPDKPTENAAQGDGSAPKTEAQITFEKIDPTKLSPSELKIYKHYQAIYTKARQRDKMALTEYNKKYLGYDETVNDPDVKALRHLKQFGRYPDGYTPGFKVPNPNDPASDPDRFLDPEVIEMKQKMSVLEQREFEREQTAALGEIEKFIEDLKKIDPSDEQVYLQNVPQMRQMIDAMRGQDLTQREKLERAWYSITGKQMYEKGQKAAWAEMQKKKNEPQPELHSSSGRSEKATQGDSVADAFSMAMKQHGGV